MYFMRAIIISLVLDKRLTLRNGYPDPARGTDLKGPWSSRKETRVERPVLLFFLSLSLSLSGSPRIEFIRLGPCARLVHQPVIINRAFLCAPSLPLDLNTLSYTCDATYRADGLFMLLYYRPYKSRGRTVGMGEFTTARRSFPCCSHAGVHHAYARRRCFTAERKILAGEIGAIFLNGEKTHNVLSYRMSHKNCNIFYITFIISKNELNYSKVIICTWGKDLNVVLKIIRKWKYQK